MNSSKVPLMFRSQLRGRCQLQYPKGKNSDSVRWIDEWTDKAYQTPPEFGNDVQCKPFSVSWRFVTNGGQDEGIIRPVIGAYGWPFYPGSSMKGVFRQACRELEDSNEIPQGTCDRLCGDAQEITPGILRFHGAYPTSTAWVKKLLDVIHPQQNWQVENQDTTEKKGSAYAQISLYQPELKFGISSSQPQDTDWELVWKIWEYGLAKGLGCRVSAGYGQFNVASEQVLLTTHLKGQGVASETIDQQAEFRPNMFRAALRGHAMRVFGGLTSERNTRQLVDELFGGISRGGAKWGLLSMNFETDSPNLNPQNLTYQVEGALTWTATRSLPEAEFTALKTLVKRLMQFAMLFGGFGKSWRRADHRIFLPDYEEHVVGCHWEWSTQDVNRFNPVMGLDQVSAFVDQVQAAARDWMALKHIGPSNQVADWREAWNSRKVQVWGRVAGNVKERLVGKDDCQAIAWFHREYSYDVRNGRIQEKYIKHTSVTGQLNQIGRIWHRMYPKVGLFRDPQDKEKRIKKVSPLFLEFLTVFPDSTDDFNDFLDFLGSDRTDFQLLWGNEQ